MSAQVIAGSHEDRYGVGSERWCVGCQRVVPANGDGHYEPDQCLGYIPGVSHACCGHGGMCEAYVVLGGAPNQSCTQIASLTTLRGAAATTFFNLVTHSSDEARAQERAFRDLVNNDFASREAEANTPRPRRDEMTAVQKEEKVFRAVLKKKGLTAGEIATRAGFPTGRGIARTLGDLVTYGEIARIGRHSGNSRPSYVRA